MARLPAALLLILLSGCLAQSPVHLPTVADEGRDRQPAQGAQNDCKVSVADLGSSRISRIQCTAGSGDVQAQLQGCSDVQGGSWLSVETAEGRFGQGNATATVAASASPLATLRIAADQDEGKEANLPPHGDYGLDLQLQDWKGEWVMATVECAV